ncbi:hypothetical protein YA0002_25730 [Pseudomonas cichorii]|uniref:hypothetical protein n=1 Tax=Pseudomonas cichorii TaxID=36746 RepID=UPI0018E64F34|nr:hypothetical protein [Pseudomonas cichorii]MBI6856164.1 hypothetical protein [Pseudomonas cichorii]
MHVLFCSYGNGSVALIPWVHENKLEDVVCLHSDTSWASGGWSARVAQGEELARSDLAGEQDPDNLHDWCSPGGKRSPL